MAHHLIGFHENVQNKTLGDLPPLGVAEGETLVTIENNGFKPTLGLTEVIGLWIGESSGNIERGRLQSPTLRALSESRDLAPLGQAAEPGSPPEFIDLRRNPVSLQEDERTALQTAAADSAAAEDHVAVMWLADQAPSQVQNANTFPVRATTDASAMTAFEWNSRDITLDSDLAAGVYAIDGIVAVGTSLIAARIDFKQQQAKPKPGFLCFDSLGDDVDQRWRYGRYGSFGQFEHNKPPAIEFLPAAADNEVQEIFLDLRPVQLSETRTRR